jgi:hypothetical protein
LIGINAEAAQVEEAVVHAALRIPQGFCGYGRDAGALRPAWRAGRLAPDQGGVR